MRPDGGSGAGDGGTQQPDGGTGGPDGGTGGPNPSDPNNATKDTDCDGLSDQVEFTTDRGNGLKTLPGVADTDGDGLQDGLELGIDTPVPGTTCVLPQDANAALKTNPVFPDTDGDGLKDGTEDANKNGKAETTETHPLLKDTDCDGLVDGPTVGNVRGEDENANGRRENAETDPILADTDGDGLLDGLERGVTVNVDPGTCTAFVPDANPSTTTNPTGPDTDGDGVNDGAEDNNHNGRVDPPELDPNVSDATGPAGQVCTSNNLRPLLVRSESEPDLSLALPPSFTEVTQIRLGTEVKGLVGYDSTTKVTFLVFRRPAPTGATDPLGDEEALRPVLSSRGALSNRTAQLFRTWEGFSALQASYDQSGTTTDLKQRTNELVDALIPGSTGRLSSGAGVTGDFRLQALYVHRSNQSLVVLVALTPLSEVTGVNASQPAVFVSQDLVEGSALAQFGEPRSVQCERFQGSSGKVDLLFVVDDSGSMGPSQASLAVAAQSAVDALNASSLDWRMAMVTSSYHLVTTANAGKLRHFTRNVNNVKAWLSQDSVCVENVCTVVPTVPTHSSCPGDASQGANGGCWVGVAGSGSEGVLGSARKALDDLTPGTAPGASESPTRARADAALAVVVLGDADDQTSGYTTTVTNCGTGGTPDREGSSCEAVQNFINFFGSGAGGPPPTNKTARPVAVHGIVCPSGSFCGCAASPCDGANPNREFNPQPLNGASKQRHATVVNATGGVLGSILDTSSISASMQAIVWDAISRGGYKTLRPPIGASMKVAVDRVLNPAQCLSSDLPRSTASGFDFDGRARTLSLFGACRPLESIAQSAVSYQYWQDTQPDPNGVPPCQNDPRYTPNEPDHCEGPTLACNGTQCVCVPNCGGFCGSGTVCSMQTCSCEPITGG